MKVIFFFILAFSSFCQAAGIEFDASAKLVQADVRKALDLLPQNYLESVKGTITIKVKALDSDRFITSDLCQVGEKSIFGFVQRKNKNHDLVLSQKLIELSKNQSEKFSCSHGSFQKMLEATLIHELTHVKDHFEKISIEPDFQRIVGVKGMGKSGKKKVLNQNSSISPDAYEFKNLEESLAVNTEYLVMDAEFECRKPATAQYLSKKLGISLKGSCQKNYKILTQSSYLEENYLNQVSINPSRIYQIHYLFAGKGKAMMSRWGHAMFRLVICAPHRKTAGPDCLKDVSHHVALSYRAFMNDMNINYVKGMFGSYPSQLFVYRFHEVQQEYTKAELRDVFSVPLKMNEEQKREFLDLTLERFWSYQGKYYFADNNCGTEAKKHLAVALDEDQASLIRSVTPYRIYKDVVKAKNNLRDGDVITFKSLYGDLESSFLDLKKLGVFRDKNFDSFVKKNKATGRLALYEAILPELKSRSQAEQKTTSLKIIFLERYLATKYSLDLPKLAFKKINKDVNLKNEVMKMGESLKTLFTQPWEVVDSQYGVPTQNEFEHQYPRFVEERQKSLKLSTENQLSNLESILEIDIFQRELDEINNIRKIKTFINQELIPMSLIN